jgi:lipopolysaccharide export system protein LptA
MAASNPRALALLALTALACQAIGASHTEQQQPILLDADSTQVDLRTNSAVFHKVRISQGTTSISADQGQASRHASGLDFDNSLWVFHGNVKITLDQGQLTSDDAAITFADKVLSKAVANGKPAAFEQHIAKTGKLAQGRAESIEYDVHDGIVHLSKNAWVSNGEDEIRGESLKYNVLAQSIIAEASEQGSQRVHIIITPPPAAKP